MSAQGLPAHILALFTPRPPPQHLPAQVDKRAVKLTGVADFVEYFAGTKPDKRPSWESPKERKERRAKEKLKTHKEELKALTDKYDPHKDANASGDPFKTLFVARISYDTTEKKLKREFEVFGSIKRVRMIYDLKGKPRGYAFIEFEHERDLKNAYKQGDGKKIDGRRVMVDVERGRTVEGWLPRRLGGGRGPGRQGKPSKKKKNQAAAAASAEAGDKDTKEKEEKPERPHKDRGEKDRGEKDRGEKDRGEKDRGEKERGDKERATAAPAGGAEGRKERDKEKDRDRDRERKKDDKEEKRRDDKKKDKKEKVQKERSRSRDRDRDRDRDREHVKKKSRRED